METFYALEEKCSNSDLLLFASKVTKNKKGGAVIVLQVSNLKQFEKFISEQQETQHGDVENGCLIGM